MSGRKNRAAATVGEMVADLSQIRATEKLCAALSQMGIDHYGNEHITVFAASGQKYSVFALEGGKYQVSLIDAQGNVSLTLEQVASMTVGIKDEKELEVWQGKK